MPPRSRTDDPLHLRFHPTLNDTRLVDEAISRLSRSVPVPAHCGRKLQTILFGELSCGRRDIFTLVRAGRKAIDEI